MSLYDVMQMGPGCLRFHAAALNLIRKRVPLLSGTILLDLTGMPARSNHFTCNPVFILPLFEVVAFTMDVGELMLTRILYAGGVEA